MKTIVFIRHGKAIPEYTQTADTDRALTEKGIRNSYIMARRLQQKDITVDAIHTSPAIRALHTAVIFMNIVQNGFDKLHIDNALYLAEENDLLQYIHQLPDKTATALIIGHNPGITHCANFFFSEKIADMATAGVALCSFNTNSWSDIHLKNAVQEWYDFPDNIS